MSILVIDVGSSSARVLLVDDDLMVISQSIARFSYQFTYEPEGAAVVDAVYLREGLEACIDETMKQASVDPVRAVGMACFASSLLGLSADNVPVTPVYTYADNRCGASVGALRQSLDAEDLRQRTGCPLHSAYYPAKLHWLQSSMGQVAVAQWLDFSTYVYQTWFQRVVPMSYSIAAWTGLFRHDTLAWDTETLAYLGLGATQFPLLADYTAAQTGLAGEYTTRWPQLADVPFHLAVGDGAAANIGSGGDRSGQVVLTVGTTAALRVVTEQPPAKVAQGLWKYRVDGQRYLLGGATSEGGNVFQWGRRIFGLKVDQMEQFLRGAKPDAHGLTVLPLLAGERSPGYAVNAVGTLHGIGLSTTAEEMLQALLEAVALRLRKISDLFDDNMERKIVYAGGGALMASPAWTQIIANALGCTLHLVDEPEVTARGVAALLLGRSDTVRGLRIVKRFEPDSAITALYAAALLRQDALYEKIYTAHE